MQARRAPERRGFGPVSALKGAALGIAGLSLWFAVNSGSLREYFKARGLRNENKRAVLELERDIGQLEEERGKLETFGFPAEKAIRERYRMRRPDEGVIYIDEPEDEKSNAREEADEKPGADEADAPADRAPAGESSLP